MTPGELSDAGPVDSRALEAQVVRDRVWRVGDGLADLCVEPVSRLTLALYAGASGDHNPLHVDVDAARAAGLSDVIAHGMLSCAYVGRFLTQRFDQAAIRSLSVRFSAMTHVGEQLTCRGVVSEVRPDTGATGSSTSGASRTTSYPQALAIAISVVNESGEVKLHGTAEIVLGLDRDG